MCLTVLKGTAKRTARKNILVYKCLDYIYGKYETPFQYLPIVFKNGMCTLKAEKFSYERYDGYLYVNRGIHAYVTEKRAKYIADKFPDTHKFYAVIPKGAKYFIGEENEIVSNELIIFKNKTCLKEYVKNNGKNSFKSLEN